MAIPLTVLLALVLGYVFAPGTSPSKSGPSVLPAITVPAPPASPAAEAPCAQVISALPVQLGPLAPRAVHPQPDSPFVVAWGDPAVVLRCGVARPARLVPDSGDLVILVGGVYWLPEQQKDATVFTTIDRAVYVEVSVPKSQDYQPLPILGGAIAAKLPAVCAVPQQGQPAPPAHELCTRRP